MLHNQLITKDNFHTIFESLSNEYEVLGGKKKVNIYVIGGAAIVLNFEYRLSTMDVDALYSDNPLLDKAIANVSKQFNLPSDWLNQDFKQTPSYSPEIPKKSLFINQYGKYVYVFTMKPEYLIAMKLKSSRPTGGDLDDIIKMIYELRYAKYPISYELIIDAYKQLYKDFSNTYDYFLSKTKETFETPIEEITYILNKS